MHLDITTPAVMFPSVSLLLLAYTNRFLALAALVRQMDLCTDDTLQLEQISNLNERMLYIKRMQYLGVSSLLSCVVSMFFLFIGIELVGIFCFALSLILMMLSLVYSLKEIKISLKALKLHLKKCEKKEN